jgi:tRNA(His) 5'-end guanylyltransferase
MKDVLGDRMKSFYEDRTRISLQRRTYTIIRIDGKAFHTYTKGLKRPFDVGLIADMDATAAYLCKNIMGAKLAYVQSDEISVLLTDFDDLGTQAWFDNNLQKMASIAASMATSEFNRLRLKRDLSILEDVGQFKMAMFDARVFQIPTLTEVMNYFIWRQQDATRNSISSVAQSLYSHKELNGVSGDQKQEMIFQKGINWNDYSYREKRGGVITKVTYVNGVQSKLYEIDAEGTFYWNNSMTDGITNKVPDGAVVRNKWEGVETPIFTQDKGFLKNIIPLNL